MIDTNFRPKKLSKGHILKHTSDDLIAEKHKCSNFINSLFDKEVESLDNIIYQQERALQRLKMDKSLLKDMKEQSLKNIEIISEKLPLVVKEEELRIQKRITRKMNKKKTKSKETKRAKLLAQLEALEMED